MSSETKTLWLPVARRGRRAKLSGARPAKLRADPAKLRIDMVSEHANPLAALGGVDGGGQNVHVAGLARALAARGHEVVVHTRREAPEQPEWVELAPGVVVHHVTAGPAAVISKDELLPHLPHFSAALEQHWRTRRPDVVHAHFWMSGLLCQEAAAPLGIPVALTFHALGSVKRRYQAAADTSPGGRLDAERQLAEQVDLIVATASEEVREIAAMGASPQRVAVVPCGVDAERFQPTGSVSPPRSARHRLVSVGRLVPRKGVDDAIRMLPALPDCELLVAGGPSSDTLDTDPEVARLRDVAESTGVSRQVKFLGAVSHDQIAPLLRSADAAVCLPWYEPFGLVPLEAMACGTPVIASRVGGFLDTVAEGRTGLLVAPHDPQAAAAAVTALLATPGLHQRMAAAGPRRVARHYTWERVAAATESAYLDLLGRAIAPDQRDIRDQPTADLAASGLAASGSAR